MEVPVIPSVQCPTSNKTKKIAIEIMIWFLFGFA